MAFKVHIYIWLIGPFYTGRTKKSIWRPIYCDCAILNRISDIYKLINKKHGKLAIDNSDLALFKTSIKH